MLSDMSACARKRLFYLGGSILLGAVLPLSIAYIMG